VRLCEVQRARPSGGGSLGSRREKPTPAPTPPQLGEGIRPPLPPPPREGILLPLPAGEGILPPLPPPGEGCSWRPGRLASREDDVGGRECGTTNGARRRVVDTDGRGGSPPPENPPDALPSIGAEPAGEEEEEARRTRTSPDPRAPGWSSPDLWGLAGPPGGVAVGRSFRGARVERRRMRPRAGRGAAVEERRPHRRGVGGGIGAPGSWGPETKF